MKKFSLILISFLIVIVIATFIINQNFKNSPDYNYITAKIDIQKGNAKLINVGFQKPIIFYNEIQIIEEKYGFKNIYIENEPSKKILTGIENYNSVFEGYLNLRNGNNWREKYQAEIDSIKKE